MTNQSSHADSSVLAGIMVIDKPLRMTSMDVVAHIRRRAGGVKTGHAGTLDPLATGVLVVALGSATKSINQLMDTTKQYETEIDLGAFTTTDDLEGDRTDVSIASPPDEFRVQNILTKFTGQIMQRPPAYSAMKINGTRAYKLARQNKPVEIPARQVTVHSIELLAYSWPIVHLHIHCDKGFYVRSLARELGEALGTGGHCKSIRRTAVGPFTIDAAIALDRLPNRISSPDLMKLDDALRAVNADHTG